MGRVSTIRRVVGAAVLFFTPLTYGEQPLPSWLSPQLAQMMESNGHGAAVQEARQIRFVSAEDFYAEFVRLNPILLGGGYNGVAFLTSDGKTIKISHRAFFDPLVHSEWQKFRELPFIQALPDSIWEGKVGDGRITMQEFKTALGILPSVGLMDPQWAHQTIETGLARLRRVRSTERELLGSVLWRPFDPSHYPLPGVVTQDGLACFRPFGKGVPLADVLQSERDGTPLHRSYSMDLVWKQFVEVQRAAEKMLLHYGVMIDLVVPGNLVIFGTGTSAHLAAIDPEIIEPTEETRLHYSKLGFVLPRLNLMGQSNAIHWPLMPNHIVSSVHWKLSYPQAVQYMRHYWGVDHQGAIDQLAQTRRWNISMFPGMNDYSNIRRAARERTAQNACANTLVRKP